MYERTKNQIGIMKEHENRQKEMVGTVQVRKYVRNNK